MHKVDLIIGLSVSFIMLLSGFSYKNKFKKKLKDKNTGSNEPQSDYKATHYYIHTPHTRGG